MRACGSDGQVVGLQVAHDLQPVLELAQEPVRVGERVRVGLRRRSPRRRAPASAASVFGLRSVGFAPAVHDLEQLDGELHVADAAASALDLGQLLAALTDVLLEADLRAADVVDRGGLEPLGVHERRHARDERRSRASGRRPRRAP